ncbi:unnamed protein product [Effrenium voratum]|nr:unnamed protein product [Effrenium voratum]
MEGGRRGFEGNVSRWGVLVALQCVLCQASVCSSGVGPVHSRFIHEQVEREATVYLPPTSEGKAVPLWLILADGSRSTAEFLNYTGLEAFTKQRRTLSVSGSYRKPARFG